MGSIIIFDTETTGLQKNDIVPLDQHPRIVEISAKKIDSETFEEIDSYSSLYNPGIQIPKEVIRVHGIDDEKVKHEKTFKEKQEELEKFFEGSEMVVAHNLSYDKYMIDVEYKRLGKTFPWPKKLVCTVNKTYSLKGYRLNLSKLYEHLFHETFEGAHRASADVDALAKCFVKLVKDKTIII